MAFLPTTRTPRLRLSARSGPAERGAGDSDAPPVLTRVIAAPMIAVAILSLVCLGLLTEISAQSAALRRVIDVDLDQVVALSNMDRQLDELEIASGADPATEAAARQSLTQISSAVADPQWRDESARRLLRHEMAGLSFQGGPSPQVRSLRAAILRRELDAQTDGQARVDAMDAVLRRAKVIAAVGAFLAVLMGAWTASLSLRSLKAEFAAVARSAFRLGQATKT